MKKDLSGVITALLTPFDSHNNVNKKALGELIERNIAAGVNGFYVCGSTAEVFLLSDAERRKVYKIVAEKAGGRVPLIAHIGAISTDQATEYGKYAKSLGYDAISAVAPFYYKFSFDSIRRHYFEIQDTVGLPMIVYNFPNFSGVNLGVAEISSFLSSDGFIGVKHTSSDYFALQQFKSAFPDKLVYNGYDETFLCGLSMGADGGIGSTYNFMADKFIKIRQLFLAGDIAGAMKLQETANKIIASLIKVGVMEGEKEVLCQMGIDFGRARSPFRELTDEQKALIAKEIIPLL